MQGDGLQLRAQVVAIPSPLLSISSSLGTEQRTALPLGHWTHARPDIMGSTGEGDPSRPLQLVAETEASTPCRCSIWERSPRPWTPNQVGRNSAGEGSARTTQALSARES